MTSGNRKYERDITSLIIRYSLPTYTPKKELIAMMENYSYAGLRMVTRHQLEKGQEVLIDGGFWEDALPAIVRWLKSIGDTTFQIGLEFKR